MFLFIDVNKVKVFICFVLLLDGLVELLVMRVMVNVVSDFFNVVVFQNLDVEFGLGIFIFDLVVI